jgi:hypothetical protein
MVILTAVSQQLPNRHCGCPSVDLIRADDITNMPRCIHRSAPDSKKPAELDKFAYSLPPDKLATAEENERADVILNLPSTWVRF